LWLSFLFALLKLRANITIESHSKHSKIKKRMVILG